jgi:predicted aspartyl protease
MLEAADLKVEESKSYLSLHALAGIQSNRAIHLMALINNQVLSILVDLGSSHTFLNESIVHKLQLLPQSVKPMTVRVANGQWIQTNKVVQGLRWWIQGYTFNTNARVLELGAYDLILGMYWL